MAATERALSEIRRPRIQAEAEKRGCTAIVMVHDDAQELEALGRDDESSYVVGAEGVAGELRAPLHRDEPTRLLLQGVGRGRFFTKGLALNASVKEAVDAS